MQTRKVYRVRVLSRRGGWQERDVAITPTDLMAETARLRRDPEVKAVEVLHEGEHLFALT